MSCYERQVVGERSSVVAKVAKTFGGRPKLWASFATLLFGLNLCVLVTDGLAAEPLRLTDDGINKRDLRFIDNGKTLVYCIDEGPDLVRMMQMNLDTREVKPVFDDAGNRHNLEPAFSPDGRFIAYTQCTGNLTARLVIHDRQQNTDAFVSHSGRGGTRSPTFSPDSRTVVYAFAETGPQQLWSVDTKAQNKKQLTECSGISNWPTFSPDGSTIVFSNSRENNYEIYAMTADGSNERRLTENSVMDIRPRVSPDGKRVTFVSMRDGNYEVYVMNLDGSDVQRVTRSEERDDFPEWHPDGQQLAIVSERDGLFDVYLVDLSDAARSVTAR